MLSILGYDKSTMTVYGVATDRKVYAKCQIESAMYPLRNGRIYGIAEEEWLRVRDRGSTILATEIPFIPYYDGTGTPINCLTTQDNNGSTWGGE